MKTEPQEVNDQNGLLIQDATNITINIPPETDLNNPEPVPSQEWDKDLCEKNRYFPAEVYANLPELYRQPSLKFSEPKERDTFLVGLFGVVSGILPNVVGNYDGKDLYPNLYVYVLGPFGEGKGNLNWSKKIGDPIDQEKLAQATELRKDYYLQIEKYNRDTKLYGQSKLTQAPEKPQLPPNLKLFITANIGKTGLLQIMQENNGRGIMFETEADTLTDAIESDHGGFSDVLRKGYAHEHLSYFRRANNEDINIASPALSVVLSSTYDQLKSLIPSIENGLFSRFLYYQIGSSPEFKDVFDDSKIGYNRYFTEIGQHFHKQYSFLQALSTPISFDLTPNQKKIFLEYFRAYKYELREFVSPLMSGVINRLGITCFRIAMQLSIVRAFDNHSLTPTQLCTDQDFENTLRIMDTFIIHMVCTFKQYPQYKFLQTGVVEKSKALEAEQIRQCRELRANGTPIREIAKIVLGNEGRKSTVERWTK